VRKLRQERASRTTSAAGDPDADRPAGTGKTSLGESVAKALNREFVRMCSAHPRRGGDPRHRRTYMARCRAGSYARLRDAKT